MHSPTETQEETEYRSLLTTLAKNEKIRAHTDPIRAALSAFEEAVAAHATATAAENETWTRLQSEKLFWTESYRKTHNALKVHYASMPRKAERFFRRIHRARGGEQPQKPAAESEVLGNTLGSDGAVSGTSPNANDTTTATQS